MGVLESPCGEERLESCVSPGASARTSDSRRHAGVLTFTATDPPPSGERPRPPGRFGTRETAQTPKPAPPRSRRGHRSRDDDACSSTLRYASIDSSRTDGHVHDSHRAKGAGVEPPTGRDRPAAGTCRPPRPGDRRRPPAARAGRPSGSPGTPPARSTPPAARSRTPPAPRSACCRCSASGCRCRRPRSSAQISSGVTRPANVTPSSRSSRECAKRRLLRPAADQGQRRFGMTILHQAKRAQRAGHVVERLEVARRHEARAERIALAKAEALEIDHVRDDLATIPNPANTSEEARRHDVQVDPAERASGHGRPRRWSGASPLR